MACEAALGARARVSVFMQIRIPPSEEEVERTQFVSWLYPSCASQAPGALPGPLGSPEGHMARVSAVI